MTVAVCHRSTPRGGIVLSGGVVGSPFSFCKIFSYEDRRSDKSEDLSDSHG